MITPALARAARGLLDWQQTDLAAAAGLSLTAIKNFESGQKRTHARTARAIQDALEKLGIEFPLSGGLRQVEELTSVHRFSGKDFIRNLNQDIYAAVHPDRDEILSASVDDAVWPQDVAKDYFAWCTRTQIKLKTIRATMPTGTVFAPKTYRVIPPGMLGKIAYAIYADRLAFILWKKKQVVVLRNAHIAEAFRNQFLYLWKMGRPLGKD